MSFANPASNAAEAAASYIARLLALLADREPLSVMDQLDVSVRAAVAGLSAEQLRRAEAPGKWSCLDVIGHLVHTEIVYGYRVRCVVAEEHPGLPGYDQDRWIAHLQEPDVDVQAALDDLAFLRRLNLRFYRRLSKSERARSGLHSERGEESVNRILDLLGAHDLVHRRQLQRIRTSMGLPKTDDT